MRTFIKVLYFQILSQNINLYNLKIHRHRCMLMNMLVVIFGSYNVVHVIFGSSSSYKYDPLLE